MDIFFYLINQIKYLNKISFLRVVSIKVYKFIYFLKEKWVGVGGVVLWRVVDV